LCLADSRRFPETQARSPVAGEMSGRSNVSQVNGVVRRRQERDKGLTASQEEILSGRRKEVPWMRTTMSLDDVLIKALMEVTKAKTKTEAIHTAIAEFL
jgi:hypothetical protein